MAGRSPLHGFNCTRRQSPVSRTRRTEHSQAAPGDSWQPAGPGLYRSPRVLGGEVIAHLLRCKVVNQSIDLGIVQALPERGHQRSAEFDPDLYILPVRLRMAQRHACVLEEMIQAGPQLSGVHFVFVDVMTHRTVVPKEIASDHKARGLPGWSLHICGGKTADGKGRGE